MRTRRLTLALVVVLLIPAWAAAQAPVVKHNSQIILRSEKGHPGAPIGDFFDQFISTEMMFTGKKVVKNAPYSGEAITETTQTLADGNRIQRKSTTKVWRDSDGRTRQEMSLDAVGPYAVHHETIMIHDPVAELSYHLEPASRTARLVPSAGPGRLISFRHSSEEAAAWVSPAMAASHIDDQAQTESLGTRVIEGVPAEGTRRTMTIPAGQIGNERPIHIVSERWLSPELQTVVLSRRSDPRAGETVYRLANISRAEPARALFEPPSDYTIKDDSTLIDKVRRIFRE